MAGHELDDSHIDYQLYRIGRVQQTFRGPPPRLNQHYIAYLGSCYTFGRNVEAPYPTIIERETGITAVNLGVKGAGSGFFLNDEDIISICGGADLCVIQVMCPRATSNRMFSVAPWRNNRLRTVSDLLIGVYPEVDFDRFEYVFGMLKHLQAIDSNRFRIVVNEMRNAWIARTRALLNTIQTRTLLFWFSERTPEEQEAEDRPLNTMHYPLFVDRSMLDAVIPAADAYVECVAKPDIAQSDTAFSPGEPINTQNFVPTAHMHSQAAQILTSEINLRLMA